jgi:hypothetical protein
MALGLPRKKRRSAARRSAHPRPGQDGPIVAEEIQTFVAKVVDLIDQSAKDASSRACPNAYQQRGAHQHPGFGRLVAVQPVAQTPAQVLHLLPDFSFLPRSIGVRSAPYSSTIARECKHRVIASPQQAVLVFPQRQVGLGTAPWRQEKRRLVASSCQAFGNPALDSYGYLSGVAYGAAPGVVSGVGVGGSSNKSLRVFSTQSLTVNSVTRT